MRLEVPAFNLSMPKDPAKIAAAVAGVVLAVGIPAVIIFSVLVPKWEHEAREDRYWSCVLDDGGTDEECSELRR